MRGAPAILVGAAITLFAALAPTASAKTYEVTRHNDPKPGKCKPSDCSVREAVLAANKHAGRDTVVLPDRNQRYDLGRANEAPPAGEDRGRRGDLDIAGPLRMTHPGVGMATIDANRIDRVLDVLQGATTLERVKVTGGGAVGEDVARSQLAPRGIEAGSGGGIRAAAPLTLVRSAVVNNGGADGGGGIEAYSKLTVNRSKVSRNKTVASTGGGIAGAGATRIIRSIVSGNRSANAGGGIVQYPGTVRIVQSTVADNVAVQGAVGVYLYEASGKIVDSTVSGNVSVENNTAGIDVSAGSQLAVVNSTVSRNRSPLNGGGIEVGTASELSLRSTTITRNVADSDQAGGGDGGGVLNAGGSVSAVNTIIALNREGSVAGDCSGTFDSGGGNLLSIETGCTGFEIGSGDFLAANPKLGKLKRNGGSTKTIALRKGSKAVGRAIKSRAPKRDQRGVKRDKRPDIGAYER